MPAKSPTHLDPAATVLTILGQSVAPTTGHGKPRTVLGRGVLLAAEIVNCDVSLVYRWSHARERGGRGGYVPHEAIELLLDYARRHKLPLTPAHFSLFGLADLKRRGGSNR